MGKGLLGKFSASNWGSSMLNASGIRKSANAPVDRRGGGVESLRDRGGVEAKAGANRAALSEPGRPSDRRVRRDR